MQVNVEEFLRERFPDKDWHHHPRTDGRTDLCDGTPSDCTERQRCPKETSGRASEPTEGSE